VAVMFASASRQIQAIRFPPIPVLFRLPGPAICRTVSHELNRPRVNARGSAKRESQQRRPDPAPLSKARIFHEGLHGFGAFLNGGSLGDFGDKEIQNLFGLKVYPKNTANITDYIDDHCF